MGEHPGVGPHRGASSTPALPIPEGTAPLCLSLNQGLSEGLSQGSCWSSSENCLFPRNWSPPHAPPALWVPIPSSADHQSGQQGSSHSTHCSSLQPPFQRGPCPSCSPTLGTERRRMVWGQTQGSEVGGGRNVSISPHCRQTRLTAVPPSVIIRAGSMKALL